MNLEKFARQDVLEFLDANFHSDLSKFLLKKSPFIDITIQELAHQLNGRRVAEKKFPQLMQKNIVFPPNINLEQTSSASTAIYKASAVNGHSFLDLTAGFGIDAFFISKNFQSSTLVEKNEELANITAHNWRILDRQAKFITTDLLQFLENDEKKFDLIYVDPARRSVEKKKVFLLEELSPNILEIQEMLLNKTDHVMIKLSPMIDLHYLISVLKNVSRIDIIAVRNEVKEIVVQQNKNVNGNQPEIFCVNLESENPDFIFKLQEENSAQAQFSEVEDYIYIPNAAILKSGAFNLISNRLEVKKLHSNTHLYTSDKYISQFPGRILKMKKISSKILKKGEKWNIISKNYPMSTAEIEKKYKLKKGGDGFLIFTQTRTEKIILQSVEN